MDLPNRRTAIESFRKGGGRIAAVFPGRYPREILLAAGFLPVEVWDPPGPIARASAHAQPFVCGVGLRGLELLLSEKTPALDCLLFPHLCDTLQNLFTVVRDCIGHPVPATLFYTPRNVADAGVASFVESQVRRLAAFLSSRSGVSVDDDGLAKAGAAMDKVHEAMQSLYSARRQGRIHASNADFYRTVRLREYVVPSEFLQAADRLMAGQSTSSENAPSGPRLVLSGVLPDRDLLALLDQLGVRLCEDDLISCGRRFPRTHVAADKDPWKASAARLLSLPPCTSIASPVEQRVAFLSEMVRNSGAAGIILHTVKFCELELFDHPFVVQGLRQAGIPVLVLESELHQPQLGQLGTRLEAFLEVLS